MDDFWNNIPGATKWTQECYQKAKTRGGVHTHFGRWRPLPWITSRVPYEVEFGERSSVNTIVQGTAADIMKMGLIRLWKGLRSSDFDARLVLTIHDSVMMEVAEGVDLKAFFEFCWDRLCMHIPDYPPLEIDAKVGRNWHDMEDFDPRKDEKPELKGEGATRMPKSVSVPDLFDEQKKTMLMLAKEHKTDHGELAVTFNLPNGTSVGPIHMDGQGYTRILKFLVDAASKNKADRQAKGTIQTVL